MTNRRKEIQTILWDPDNAMHEIVMAAASMVAVVNQRILDSPQNGQDITDHTFGIYAACHAQVTGRPPATGPEDAAAFAELHRELVEELIRIMAEIPDTLKLNAI